MVTEQSTLPPVVTLTLTLHMKKYIIQLSIGLLLLIVAFSLPTPASNATPGADRVAEAKERLKSAEAKLSNAAPLEWDTYIARKLEYDLSVRKQGLAELTPMEGLKYIGLPSLGLACMVSALLFIWLARHRAEWNRQHKLKTA